MFLKFQVLDIIIQNVQTEKLIESGFWESALTEWQMTGR